MMTGSSRQENSPCKGLSANEVSIGPAAGNRRSRRLFVLFTIAAFFLALAIRLHNLDRTSLWLDEVLQLRCATESFGDIWSCAPTNKPPLDYYIQWLFVRGGADEFHARLHACLLGAGAVVAFGLWGMAMGGWALSLIAVCLSLALPLLVRFSQEGRPYSLMLLAECLFFAAFWNLARRSPKSSSDLPAQQADTTTAPANPEHDPVKIRSWIVLGIALALCLWSLYWAWLSCALSALFALIWWLIRRGTKPRTSSQKRKTLTIALLCIGAAIVSALPLYLRATGAVHGTFYAPFDPRSWSWIGLYLDIYAQGYEWTQYTHGAGSVIVTLALIGWLGWAVRRRTAPQAHFCALQFAALFLGAFLFFHLVNHWMEVRYTLSALPPSIMLAAMGIESIGCAFALLLQRVHPISPRLRCILFWLIVVLVSLSATLVSLRYVLRNPLERLDWRGVCQRIMRESTQQTAILVGEKNDERVLRHYFQRYNIGAPLVVANYDVPVVQHLLAAYQDVWVIVRQEANVPDPFREAIKTLNPEYPSFWRLDVRRSPPSLAVASKRAELRKTALGGATRQIVLYPGRQDCPYLGAGWALPEKWGETEIRAVDGSFAEFFLPVLEPKQTVLTLRVSPFSPDREPPLRLQIKINETPLDQKPVEKGWNDMTWEVKPELLRKGLNAVHLLPNRAIRPSSILPGNTDNRQLSVWVERIEARVF
jgi:hypothetical protein